MTFTSTLSEAWIVDEAGEKRAGGAFLRGSQAGQAGGLIAIPISIALGSVMVRLSSLLGSGLMVLLAAFLALTMTRAGLICAISKKQLEFRVRDGPWAIWVSENILSNRFVSGGEQDDGN